MKITQITEIEIKFSIEEHLDNEGGMGVDTFEENLDTLEDAVSALIRARTVRPNHSWNIIGIPTAKKKFKGESK